MARIKTPRIYDLKFDGVLEGLNVRVKSIKFGRVRKLLALLEEDGNDTVLLDESLDLLSGAIVSWDLLEEDGTLIEPSREAIEDLEFDEVMEIINKWLEQMTGPDKDLGKGSASGGTFPGQPLTMEAL